MKESKREAYINTILKFQPKHTKESLERLQDKDLSTLYKKCNVLPSIIRTQPKDVKSFRRKLFKNKNLLFEDIGCISCIREQDNNSFELKVDIKHTKFVSEINELMNYDRSAYVRKELNKLYSDDFHYALNVELDVNETGFWYWNRYDEKETECFMYLIIVVKNLKFKTTEKKIFTGESRSRTAYDYYDKPYYALWLELDNGRCGYLSSHIIGNKRSNIRFATRIDDLNICRYLSKSPSITDFFTSNYTDFKYIKKAEIVECRYKYIRDRLVIV